MTGIRLILDIRLRQLTSQLTLAVVLLGALLLTGCSRHDCMLGSLKELERRNAADSLMTDRAEAERLADYFDAHGDANERMRAHYILGRTLADLGDAPAALASYQDAIERADTTAAACDWYRLSRVYSQMADVFYYQNLMDDNLDCLDRSIYYAWLACDTGQALNSEAHKIGTYVVKESHALVVASFDALYPQLQRFFGDQYAACYATLPVLSLLELGDTAQALYYFESYRDNSCFIDSVGDVAPGHEGFYFYGGRMHLALCQYDSAEYYFRKELQVAEDFTNQSMAARGLSLLYTETGQLDSALKYSLYSYAVNDSAYQKMATSEVERTHALYNYARHQRMAQQARAESEQRLSWIRFLSEILVLVVLGFVAWLRVTRTRRKIAETRLLQKEQELHRLEADLNLARDREREFELLLRNIEGSVSMSGANDKDMIQHVDHLRQHLEDLATDLSRKEEQIVQLQAEVNYLTNKKHDDKARAENRLASSDKYNRFREFAVTSGKLSQEDFDRIDRMAIQLLPTFHQFISANRSKLSETQCRLCLLLRFHLDMNQSARLLGVSASFVSKTSKDVLKKLFDVDGNGLRLKKELEELC